MLTVTKKKSKNVKEILNDTFHFQPHSHQRHRKKSKSLDCGLPRFSFYTGKYVIHLKRVLQVGFFFKYMNKNCIKLYVLFWRLQFLLNSITWVPSRFPKINPIYSFLIAVETSIKYLYNNLSIIPLLTYSDCF